jgi:hypothetical protein
MDSIEAVLVIFVIGISLFLVGIQRYNKRRRLLRTGVHVEGKIFQIINTGNSESTTYYPVIRFETIKKEEVTEKYKRGGNRWTYKEGETVNIIYDALNPGHFLLDDPRAKTGSKAFIWGGILLVLISAGLLWMGLRV